ncbi:MAG: cupin domain-containing protein [Acidobacteriaceae bacterium]|jgi:predicted cupin superfamily sugar epimerase
MTAAEVKKLLNLTPHFEGGAYIRTYESGERLAPAAFADSRYPTPRHTGTAIYYFLEPGAFSEIHRLRSDEIFHFYLGDPVEMLQLTAPGAGRVLRIGTDLAAGERPQVVVPRDIWQGTRLVPGGQWALLGCTVSPGFEYEDYDRADRAQLIAAWPAFTGLIRALTR